MKKTPVTAVAVTSHMPRLEEALRRNGSLSDAQQGTDELRSVLVQPLTGRIVGLRHGIYGIRAQVQKFRVGSSCYSMENLSFEEGEPQKEGILPKGRIPSLARQEDSNPDLLVRTKHSIRLSYWRKTIKRNKAF